MSRTSTRPTPRAGTAEPRPAARRAAVLGSPVAHSLSPALHRAAYAALGLDDWRYDRFEVDEEGLPRFLDGLGPEWAGCSLTMPLKRAVLPLLDEISEVAASIEAVNTLVFAPDGRRLGDNTDVPGMIAALREAGTDRVEEATVLGAGATASSALAALGRIGAARVTAYVRSPERAAQMRGWGERLGLEVATAPWEEAHRGLGAPLVVATTPAGSTDELAAGLRELPGPGAPAGGGGPLGTLFDVLYEPWPTALAAAWAARGGPVVGGLDLLVHQAVLQVEQMTGRAPAPVKEMRAAGEAALSAR
ncbi:shikimate dehydrogenase [Streptomyces hoynatensis]|uniref:Shikimate dehydrogenase n=1 Tax=Streptomyces hoynatensis TaxID=1141874 RepID=A0A3A9Z8W4_9ACTN|nr:shikimate dehydrogenase [Streptomyces hoynatensis]RKN44703.1 shikimate dehydrogenase [Streptomyces hoynatensis]